MSMMRGEPFLQRDLVHVMERKAIMRPPSQPHSASARPTLRPRSANASQEPTRPQTGEDGHRRLHASHMGPRADQRAGYTFSAGSSPRPEAHAATDRGACRQPLSALQASQRKRLGTVEPPSIADLTTRLRAKSQDVHGLLNFVLSIFDQGSIPLPQSDQLRSLPPAAAAGAAPNAAAKRPKEGAAAN